MGSICRSIAFTHGPQARKRSATDWSVMDSYRAVKVPATSRKGLSNPQYKPTVSPSTIPLVYYHINSFQRASSVERPLPGGENRTTGRASHHEESCSDWVGSPHAWT